MSGPQNTPSEIELTFDIVRQPDRPVLPVSGAWGGLNAQGQIVAHFYIEYPDVPPQASVILDRRDGHVIKQDMSGKKQHYTREVVATVSVPPDVATALGNWFISQAKQASELISKQ